MKIFAATHRGLVKKVNEDRFLVKEYENGSALVAVADGLGGHAAGERAAEIAVQALNDFDADSLTVENQLIELVQTAHSRIMKASAADLSLNGMATTLTAAFVTSKVAHWVHVGDCRLYFFREGELVCVTEDHTVSGILLRAGEIGAEEARVHPARHILMSCLGRGAFEVDTGSLELEDGDLFLISSDGLHDRVPEEVIASNLRNGDDIEAKLNAMVTAALEAGGKDNVTVVGVDIQG